MSFSCAVSVQIASFFEECTLDVLIVSLNSCPKAELLISLAARQRVIFQVYFPDPIRAYSLDHMGHHLPQYIKWPNQEAGTLSQAGCTGRTRERIVVLQAVPKTGLND